MHRPPAQVEHDRRVGDLLRRARESRGLSQRQLAAAMLASGRPGWSHTRVGWLERGQRSIAAYELTALADVLDVDPGVLHPQLVGAGVTERQRQRAARTAVAAAYGPIDPLTDARCRHLQRLCELLVGAGRQEWDYDLQWQIIFTPEQLEQTIRLAEKELEELYEQPPLEPALT